MTSRLPALQHHVPASSHFSSLIWGSRGRRRGVCSNANTAGLQASDGGQGMRYFGPWEVVTTEKSSIFYEATPSSLPPSWAPLKTGSRMLPAQAARPAADCEMRVDIIKKPLSQNQCAVLPPPPSLLFLARSHVGSA